MKTHSLLQVTIIISLVALCPAKVSMLHYGKYGGLQLTCERTEMIMIKSQVLGFSDNAPKCDPSPECSRPYTLGKWYCRGKTSSCSGMQVERWPLLGGTCSSSFTNCLRIEYECVKGKKSCYKQSGCYLLYNYKII